ncbi:uncharacterized protein LOC125580189 [Brassica napus]|uniref:uncharacterized protein LOC125580189 n=1 Tax=Brassica napus TaxID=3708 RepID=UPI0020791E9B|nr:uncharacterized protein LOC125580189 [Brassica napus]
MAPRPRPAAPAPTYADLFGDGSSSSGPSSSSGQFQTLTHLGEFLRPLLLFHLRCLPHELHLSPRISLPHRLQFIPICGCQLMHHSQDTPSRICLPSPDERVYTFWTPIDPRVLIGLGLTTVLAGAFQRR